MRQPLMVFLLLVGLACGFACVYDLSQDDPLSHVEALIALVGFAVCVAGGYVGSSLSEMMQRMGLPPVPQQIPQAQQMPPRQS